MIVFILLASFPVSPADVQTNNDDNQDEFYSSTQNYTQLNPEVPNLPSLPTPRDLYISAGDIKVNPNNPIEGDKIDITAIIHNKNRFPTYNLVVKIYDNQTEIYKYTTQFLYNVSFNITTSLTIFNPGEHSIDVKIDPDNKTREKDKSNNEAKVQITVKSKNVYKVSIDCDIKNKTVKVGESVVYIINVKNLGNVNDDIGLKYEYLNVTNITSSWKIDFSKNKVSVSSGKNASVDLVITPPSNAKDGDVLDIRVIAFSVTSPHTEDSITITTTVVSEGGTEEGTEVFFLPGMEGIAAVIAIGAVTLRLRGRK